MRKPRIASELIAAELSSAEYSVEESERGDASTEFVMVGALLVLLTMAILQVSFALYARTMLVDAAAAGHVTVRCVTAPRRRAWSVPVS